VGSFEVLAVSPGLPVEDLLAHPEGGRDAALRIAGALLPDLRLEHEDTRTWVDPGRWELGSVLVSTFGTTALFLHPQARPTPPTGMSTFSLTYQSVSMAYGIDVSGPRFRRTLALSPGVLDYAEGAPLPFEAAFDNVTEASATYSFDDVAFAAAAAEWMFGCQALDVPWSDGTLPVSRVQLGDMPLHVLTAEAVAPRVETPARSAPRGVLSRLLRRS
jgi:hypothetical protein